MTFQPSKHNWVNERNKIQTLMHQSLLSQLHVTNYYSILTIFQCCVTVHQVLKIVVLLSE